jgi:hypothetical protein
MADYSSLEHDEVVALGRQFGVRVPSLRRLEGGMRNSSVALDLMHLVDALDAPRQ